jgi:hypothetical protein
MNSIPCIDLCLDFAQVAFGILDYAILAERFAGQDSCFYHALRTASENCYVIFGVSITVASIRGILCIQKKRLIRIVDVVGDDYDNWISASLGDARLHALLLRVCLECLYRRSRIGGCGGEFLIL